MPDDSAHKEANGMLRHNLLLRIIKRIDLHSFIRHAEVGALEKIIGHIQYKKNKKRGEQDGCKIVS